MVNLKKVGAIASGALFVGSTLGMAAAVNVPSDFSSSMLAEDGVAKAQLVVGSDAPGKTADEASAQIIADAANSELTSTSAGDDIDLAYSSALWDDSASTIYTNNSNWTVAGATPNTDPVISGAPYDGAVMDVSKMKSGYIRIDGNGDGDVTDTSDYDIYSSAYVVDGSAGSIQMAYNFSTVMDNAFSIDSSGHRLTVGNTFKVKGVRYTVTGLTSDKEIKIGPTKRVTLASVSQNFAANAVILDGTRKLAYYNTSGGGTIYFINGNEIEQQYSFTGTKLADISAGISAASFASDYSIYVNATDVSSTTGTTMYLWAVANDDVFAISDAQSDVLGYDKAYYDQDFSSPTFKQGGLWFTDDNIQLTLDGTVDVPGTEYTLTWKNSKAMQLRRSKEVTVASGTALASTLASYSGFLKAGITPKNSGGDIDITYSTASWDDSGWDLNWTNTTGHLIQTDPNIASTTVSTTCTGSTCTNTSINFDGQMIQVNKGKTGYVRIDGNADGDMTDTSDYDLYSDMYLVDGSAGSVQWAYNFSTVMDNAFSIDSSGHRLTVGNTFKVKGVRYTVTGLTSDKEIKIGPTKRVTLASVSQNFAANAVILDGTRKLAYYNTSGGGTIYFINGNEIEQQYSFTGTKLADISAGISAASFASDYSIYVNATDVSSTTGTTMYLWAVANDDVFAISDAQSDVLGYDKAYYDQDFSSPTFKQGGLWFTDDNIQLTLDGTVDVPGTEYTLTWKNSKVMQLRRSKEVTIASGTKMLSTLSAYSSFISTTVTATQAGTSGTVAPTLDIVTDDDASSSINQVLVGGPVANSLVASLVTAGSSSVGWASSDGDIEVVAGAPADGYSSIIVAGATRTETAAAAQALADAL